MRNSELQKLRWHYKNAQFTMHNAQFWYVFAIVNEIKNLMRRSASLRREGDRHFVVLLVFANFQASNELKTLIMYLGWWRVLLFNE